MNRNRLRKMILKEFKIMGLADMGSGGLGVMGLGKGVHHDYNKMSQSHGCDSCGHSPCQCADSCQRAP